MTSDQPSLHWVDVVGMVLLAVAAVATSWSSYQATRWNGEQAKAGARANALRIESAREDGLARTQQQVDVATYIAWVNAAVEDDLRLQEFYVDRFRAEFRVAFDAWIATDPLTNPDAPATPFVMPEYELAAETDSERLQAEADVKAAEARRATDRAGDYVLGVVMFAVALFFAGMSSKLAHPTLRIAMLVTGLAVFALTAARIATFPVRLA